MLDLVELLLNLLARGFGAEAYDDDGREAEHEAGDEFVNLEDFGGESGEVELPHERGDAADEHAGDSARKRGTLPEQGEEHDRAEGGAESAPGKAHEAHHDV